MISYEDRKRLLLAEFELIDTDHDYIFSKADLIRYLDRRNVPSPYSGGPAIRSTSCQRAV